MASDEPNWPELSKNLKAAIRAFDGPLPLENVAMAYTRCHGTPFNLQGKKLRACVQDRLLSGVRINWGGMTLEVTGKAGKKTPQATTKNVSRRLGKTPIAVTASGSTNKTEGQKDPFQALLLPATGDPSTTYHVVEDEHSLLLAMGIISPDGDCSAPLQEVFTGHATALRLTGRALGTEDGRISLIAVSMVPYAVHNECRASLMCALFIRVQSELLD